MSEGAAGPRCKHIGGEGETWPVIPPIKALISVSKRKNLSKQLRDAVLATMQGHVLTRMQAVFDFLTDQRVVALHALSFRGR